MASVQVSSTAIAGRAEPRLARVAARVADPTRARMPCFLLSGEYASASELARAGTCRTCIGISACRQPPRVAQRT